MPRTVVITGASTGIGRATATLFQARDWNVVATMRQPADGAALAAHDNVLVTRLDVTDRSTIAAAVDAALARYGQIDVLVNNAGYGAYGPLEAFPMENVERQFATNVIGLLAVTKAVVPHFRKRGAGVIVNISSMGGQVAFPMGTLYHGSKFAVEGLSEALSYEMSAIGVRVKIVEPGRYATDFSGRSFDLQNDPGMREYQGLAQALLKAWTGPDIVHGDAAEAAEVIYRAATDDSDRLRYTAGEDARQLLADRKALDDESFIRGIKASIGIT